MREIDTGWISTETFLEGWGGVYLEGYAGLRIEAWGGMG